MKIIINNLFFDHSFSVRYTFGFVFSNKYDATKTHPWGGKCGIISKLLNCINTSNVNNSLVICRIIKEVLLSKADGFKVEPDMKGWIKTGRKSIIDMDSHGAQIITDAVESGMSALTSWLLVKDHREVKDLLSLCISVVGTYIYKSKPLVENLENEKQLFLDINAPTCKDRVF